MSTSTTPQTEPAGAPNEIAMATEDILFEEIMDKPWKEAEIALKKLVPQYLLEKQKAAGLDRYNVLLFLDQSNSIGEDHADRIYRALSSYSDERDLLMVLGSRGGRIEPSYLISKNCNEVAKDRFVVAIPRRAKSAATLLSLGADEIHMGSMSELGPIDPQLGQLPALSLTNALQTLAKTVCEHPGSADMISSYLQAKLDLGVLGYFERINESAVQYASRLLSGKTLGGERTPATLAHHLVNHYKDHSFVIDKDEALELFGSNILKIRTTEYLFANEIDRQLRWFSKAAKWFHKKEVTFVGTSADCLKIRDIKDENPG
jgi:hypothetical protein